MSNRFVVDLGDLKLDSAAKRSIANAIQAAALGELAKLDTASTGPYAVFDPVRIRDPRWYGIWIKQLINTGGIPSWEKEMEGFEKFAQAKFG